MENSTLFAYGTKLLAVGLAVGVVVALLAPNAAVRLEPMWIRGLLGLSVAAIALLAWWSRGASVPSNTHTETSKDESSTDHVADPSPNAVSQGMERSSDQDMLMTTILNAMAEGVVVCDQGSHVVLVNLAARQLLGLESKSGIEGRLLLEVCRAPRLKDAMDDAMAQGDVIRRDLVMRRKTTLHLAMAVAPIFENGVIGGAVAVMHDVSQLKRLERIRRDFVANVSHELRTPLTTISGYSETLLSGAVELDPIAEDFIEIIERNARRLTSMVEDLLVLARLEASGEYWELGPIRLFSVVSNVIEALEQSDEDTECDLVVEVDDAPLVLAERRALTQVVRNLVENAVKYTGSDGCVYVRASLDDSGENVLLKVIDTGIGIEPVHLPRLFERFYRVDDGRSRDDGGSGLGLAIVKHMVLTMNGDISVESKPGEGSTFTVTLQRAPVVNEAPALRGETDDDRDAIRA